MFTLPPLFTSWWRSSTRALGASLGWVTTCAVLASGLLTYVAGIVRQQLGTRWMYVVATVLMMVSLAVVVVDSRSLPVAYMWALLSGASSAFTYSPSLTAVQEWFPRQLGLVTGLVNVSFALPAAAAAPVVAAMLKHWGFTDTVVTLMIGVAVTQVLVIFLSTPHWLEKERRAGLAASREEISAPSATTAQAVRTHAFWQVWAIWFAGGGAAITMMTFAATYSAHLNDIGVRVSAVAAVTAFVSGKWADTSDQRDGARSCRTDGHRSRDFLDPCHGVRVVGFRHQWSGTHRGGFPGRSRFGDNLHDLALVTDTPLRSQTLWAHLWAGLHCLRCFWCFRWAYA